MQEVYSILCRLLVKWFLYGDYDLTFYWNVLYQELCTFEN